MSNSDAGLLGVINEVSLNTVYREESFPSKESDIKILQSIYFVHKVGIISSYSRFL